MSRPFLMLLSATLLIVTSMAVALADSNNRAGYGYVPGGLYCPSTTCNAQGQACTKMQKTDPHPFWGEYEYCGCPGGGEPSCCHLIKKENAPADEEPYASIGACKATIAVCPEGNFCDYYGLGTPYVSYTAFCKDVP